MMNPISLAFNLINGYKTYSSVILAVASGVGMIATKNYSEGLSQILQGMTVVFSGASMASMRHAVAKVEDQGGGSMAEVRHAVARFEYRSPEVSP
jgi:RsiW-degrading membrane proteinase PrsW (M82 family)